MSVANRVVGIVMALVWVFLALVLTAALTVAGPAYWLVPLACAGLLIWQRRQPAFQLLAYSPQGTRRLLIWTGGITLLLAFGMMSGKVSVDPDEEARKIVALGKTDPAEQQRRLSATDDHTLAALAKLDSRLAAVETERRRQLAIREAAQKAAEDEAKQAEAQRLAVLKEQSNQRQIEALLTELKDGVGGKRKRAIYQQLTELAPANQGYATTLAQIDEEMAFDQAVLDDPKRGLTLVTHSWYKSGFGSIMMADFTIRNDARIDLKDVTIKCVHSAPSGTEIDSNSKTIFEPFPKGKTRKLRDVNMGFIRDQAARSGCEIINAKVAGLDDPA